MTGTAQRERLCVEVTNWLFPRETPNRNVKGVNGPFYRFDLGSAGRVIGQLPDATLTSLADAVLGRESTTGSLPLIGHLAVRYVREALQAAKKGDAATDARVCEALLDLDNALAFSDLLEAERDAEWFASDWFEPREWARLASGGMEVLGQGRATHWRGRKKDWLLADADEFDEARARFVISAVCEADSGPPSRELVAYVRANISRLRELVPALRERGTRDVAAIAAVLDAPAATLAEGSL